MTLMELMVVLSIMGLLATAIVPSAGRLMGENLRRSAHDELEGCWKLARALALAQGSPVLFQLQQARGGLVVRITEAAAADQGADPPPILRSLRLEGWQVEVEQGPAAMEEGRSPAGTNCWQVVIAPHGVSQELKLTLRRQGRVVSVLLPGVIDAGLPAAKGGMR